MTVTSRAVVSRMNTRCLCISRGISHGKKKKKGKKRKESNLASFSLFSFFFTFFLSPLQTHRSFNWISREKKKKGRSSCPRLFILAVPTLLLFFFFLRCFLLQFWNFLLKFFLRRISWKYRRDRNNRGFLISIKKLVCKRHFSFLNIFHVFHYANGIN